MQTTSIN
ncbi:hypothetical protein D030_1322A, partial [Vibrio parahaemolyticus AQ3810]